MSFLGGQTPKKTPNPKLQFHFNWGFFRFLQKCAERASLLTPALSTPKTQKNLKHCWGSVAGMGFWGWTPNLPSEQ